MFFIKKAYFAKTISSKNAYYVHYVYFLVCFHEFAKYTMCINAYFFPWMCIFLICACYVYNMDDLSNTRRLIPWVIKTTCMNHARTVSFSISIWLWHFQSTGMQMEYASVTHMQYFWMKTANQRRVSQMFMTMNGVGSGNNGNRKSNSTRAYGVWA